jgi:hypothetical protein
MPSALGKKGTRIRLHLASALFLAAVSPPAGASEDLLNMVTGLDYGRHILMKPGPCLEDQRVEPVPGLRLRDMSCPEKAGPPPPTVSAAQSLNHRNLLDKGGSAPDILYRENTATLELRLHPHRMIDLRATGERGVWKREYEGSPPGFAWEHNADAWRLQGNAAFTLTPWLIPVLSAGTGPGNEREFGVALRGVLSGFSWSLATGRKQRDISLMLDLPDYTPLTLPFILRQDYRAAALSWTGQRVEAAWTTTMRENRHPDRFDSPYSLSDSGRNITHAAGTALFGNVGETRYRASLEGEYVQGRHVFRGVRAGEVPYQFSYEEARHHLGWLRADLQGSRGAWEGGLFAGGAWINATALRPETAGGRYFWDRSGVMDSFEGNVLDIFSRETWLFDGNARFSQKVWGGWLATPIAGWRCRLGVSYLALDGKAGGHLTKRTSMLIIAYTETDHFPESPEVRAQVLMPELKVSRRFGHAFLEASMAQAIPVGMTLRHSDGTDAPTTGRGGSKWSGGTEANLRIGWGIL